MPTDDGDVEIVLFVKMKSGLSLDEVKISEIKINKRQNNSKACTERSHCCW